MINDVVPSQGAGLQPSTLKWLRTSPDLFSFETAASAGDVADGDSGCQSAGADKSSPKTPFSLIASTNCEPWIFTLFSSVGKNLATSAMSRHPNGPMSTSICLPT